MGGRRWKDGKGLGGRCHSTDLDDGVKGNEPGSPAAEPENKESSECALLLQQGTNPINTLTLAHFLTPEQLETSSV